MIKSYYKSIKKKQVSEYFKCIIKNRFDDMESLLITGSLFMMVKL